VVCVDIDEVAAADDVEEDAAVVAAAALAVAGIPPTARLVAADHHRRRDSWAVVAVGDVALFLLYLLLLLYLLRHLHREMVVVVAAAVDGTLVAMEIVGRLQTKAGLSFFSKVVSGGRGRGIVRHNHRSLVVWPSYVTRMTRLLRSRIGQSPALILFRKTPRDASRARSPFHAFFTSTTTTLSIQ
jgi:hypothetical protein